MRPVTISSAALHAASAALRLCAAVLALVGLGCGTALSVTFLDTGFGTPLGAFTARGLALGSTGVSLTPGADALILNPASLGSSMEGLAPEESGGPYGRFRTDVSLGLTQANEDRLVPLFDTFTSFENETIIALNRNTYGAAQGGVVWRLPGAHPMSFGAGVFDRYDFDYKYFEEFRDPDPQTQYRDRILQNRKFDVDGRLRSLTAGYGAELVRDVRLGLAVHRYFGKVSWLRSVDVVAVSSPDTVSTIDQSLDGWGWSVGAQWHPEERLDLGVSFEGPFTVDGERSSLRRISTSAGTDTLPSGADSFDYPATLRFGATYHPRNPLRTTFAVEMERRFWERLDEVAVIDVLGRRLTPRDTWDFRLGLEHVFYNGLPVRFGFRYLENYADPESERATFSIGIGHKVAGFRLDVTGLYHRQTSRQGFLFSPAYTVGSTNYPSPNDSKVEDGVVQLVLGVSGRF